MFIVEGGLTTADGFFSSMIGYFGFIEGVATEVIVGGTITATAGVGITDG